MKTFGIAAGALVLVGAAATPAFAQSTQPTTPPSGRSPSGTSQDMQGTQSTTPPSTQGSPTATPENTAPTPMTPQENRPTVSTEEVGRDVGGYMSAPVRAPSKAFEIGVDAGYTQGFGNISRGRGVGDVAGAGGTIGLGLGYRINPRFSVSAGGAYQGFGNASATAVQIAAERAATVRGVSGGIEGTYHVSPYNRVDPHVSVGAGYRVLMESPPTNAPTTLTHGFELAKVEVGLDVRPSESIAISPVLGADLNMFMWRSGGGAETAALTNRGLNTFVFAGIKGRFDVGGSRDTKVEQQDGRR